MHDMVWMNRQLNSGKLRALLHKKSPHILNTHLIHVDCCNHCALISQSAVCWEPLSCGRPAEALTEPEVSFSFDRSLRHRVCIISAIRRRISQCLEAPLNCGYSLCTWIKALASWWKIGTTWSIIFEIVDGCWCWNDLEKSTSCFSIMTVTAFCRDELVPDYDVDVPESLNSQAFQNDQKECEWQLSLVQGRYHHFCH